MHVHCLIVYSKLTAVSCHQSRARIAIALQELQAVQQQGATANMPVAGGSKRDACKTEACGIQDCLAKNGYDMNKCSDKVDKLKQCCSSNMKESVHCGLVDSRTDTDSGDSQAPDDQVQ